MLKKLIKGITLLSRESRLSFAAEYSWYPGPATWCLRVYDRVLRKAAKWPLPFRKSLVRIKFRGMETPFHCRLGSSDLQLHQTIRFRGEYSPILEADLPSTFRQVVDLGSNAGYTMRMWRELFPWARLIGVEPDPDNLRVCRMNVQAIPGGRVDLVQACADGKSGSVFLDRSEMEHRFHIGDGPSPNAIQVPAFTVPEILEITGADLQIDLLKCDVQGAEKAIFADCFSWIWRVKNMIVEVHPPYTSDNLIADLRRNGWSWQKVDIHCTDNLFVLFFRA